MDILIFRGFRELDVTLNKGGSNNTSKQYTGNLNLFITSC